MGSGENPILGVICIVLQIYMFVLLARAIWSWFPVPPTGPLRGIHSFLLAITEPILKPLRAAIPPMRMGSVGFDVAFLVAFVVLVVLRQALCL